MAVQILGTFRASNFESWRKIFLLASLKPADVDGFRESKTQNAATWTKLATLGKLPVCTAVKSTLP